MKDDEPNFDKFTAMVYTRRTLEAFKGIYLKMIQNISNAEDFIEVASFLKHVGATGIQTFIDSLCFY